jgi:predicted RNA-binding Zn-ribbon protein involved in translation (DUF1610 family)
MQVNLNQYKGAIIDYGCSICQKYDNYFEDFTNKISRIKSDSCDHFDIKFIYNLDKNILKYMVSFNCKNCGVNKIFDLYKNSNVYNIHYICNNCKNGDSNVQMLLSDEIIKDDDSQKKNIIKNKVYNMQIKSNNNNFANFNNNLNQINNFNNIHPINNMNLVGGNPNPMNNMMNNNFIFNNNMMMNNFMFNNNMNMPQINQINMLMGNMNINNINNNLPNFSNQNKKHDKQINIIFKDTTGVHYNFSVSSLDCVFSEVVREFLKKNPNINIDEVGGFLCDAHMIQNHKTLKENNISENKIIVMIRAK